tara:strand:+ start:4646 stop:4864 length:219 start_codon:yes stop_codon:yes gene_type:complete
MGGAVRAVTGVVKSVTGGSPKLAPPPKPPAAPQMAKRPGVKKQKYGRSQTILTSSQGVEEEANVVKKTLLGA